eukprot:scaffold49582_cov31-Tisochrysis_lutea.AAC.1
MPIGCQCATGVWMEPIGCQCATGIWMEALTYGEVHPHLVTSSMLARYLQARKQSSRRTRLREPRTYRILPIAACTLPRPASVSGHGCQGAHR